MFFQQFYLETLGHASYLIGSEETGEALVLDVRRDVDGYFAAAREQGLRIAYACDTHQHNDYLSGICELPHRGEVQLLAAARAELSYPVQRLADGARFEMGEVVFEALHTPGHTPEHMALLVTDRSRGEEPMLLLSGGALLVGSVARPDLLGDETQTHRNALDLCHSLRDRILPLPDHVELYPTHVAGSLCGGGIARRLSSTIGFERRVNRMLAAVESEAEFVKSCLDTSTLPAIPPYWSRMRTSNQQGVPPLGVLRDPPPLDVHSFDRLRRGGALVLDCRAPEAFSSHVPSALNVGLTSAFATWAGTVLPPGQAYVLVLDRPGDLWEVCWQLLRIGYELPQGWLAGGMRAWRLEGQPLQPLPQWSVMDLERERRGNPRLFILDVRQPAEWQAQRVPGAVHITGAELPVRLSEVPRDRPIAVVCGTGYRSSVAASLLQHHGFGEVANVLGGVTGWVNARCGPPQ